MSTTTNHKRTRIIALVTALLVVAGVLGIAPRVSKAVDATHGDLVVTKTFAGDELTGDEKASFTITVARNDGDTQTTLPTELTITSTGADPKTVTAAENKFTFELKNGETATIKDANPCKAKVEEQAIEGFTTTVNATQGGQALENVKSLPADVTITNAETKVAVTNTKNTPTGDTGKLAISKTIEGADTEALKATEFNFQVDLTKDGNADNGIYKYTGSKDGTVRNGESVSLKGGESITIEGIPADIDYTVTEDTPAAGWTNTKKENDTGKIAKDETKTAAFTNTYSTTPTGNGQLKISKTVSLPKTQEAIDDPETSSSDVDKYKERLKEAQSEQFTFTVKLTDADDKALTDEYEYKGTLAGEDVTGKIKDGGTVTLAHGDSVTVTGLPDGSKWTVTENTPDNWKVDEVSKKGTISSNGASDASFTNTALGALEITKDISAASGVTLTDDLKATEFTFTVTFTQDDQPVEGEFTYTGSRSGSIKSGDTVTLKDGEKITFTNLPVGIKARVAETQLDNWISYKKSSSGLLTRAAALNGDIVEYTARTANFQNVYQGTSSSSSGSSSTRSGSTGTTTSRTTTPATADATNVAVPVVLGALAAGMVVAGRMIRSKE